MKIKSAKTVRVEKWVRLNVEYKGNIFEVSVFTENGKVMGDNHSNSLYTSYLTYFNTTPDHIRQKHFNLIKKYVEKHIK